MMKSLIARIGTNDGLGSSVFRMKIWGGWVAFHIPHSAFRIFMWGMIFFGCGVDIGEIAPKSTERTFQDGRVYILNNIRPFGSDNRVLFITYDGQRFDPPHNMTFDGEPTLAGSLLITPEPIPGGTPLDFDYSVWQVGDIFARKLSAFFGGPVIIDGDITIEFYNDNWEDYGWSGGVLALKVIPGKYDSVHIYKR